jgi:hypothetical protein
VELFGGMESGLPRVLAPHASPGPKALSLANISQLIVGERAVLFERKKRADAQRERRHSPARTIKLNRYARLPVRLLTPGRFGDQARAALASEIRP